MAKRQFKRRRKYFSAREKEAFFSGLIGYPVIPEKEKEKKSYFRGRKIGETEDYQLAERFCSHMEVKFGQSRKTSIGSVGVYDKKGRRLGLDGKPLPSAYSIYTDMQKDPSFKEQVYDNYKPR